MRPRLAEIAFLFLKLGTIGFGGPAAAARATHRLLGDAAPRELSLATLQVWQAFSERVAGRTVREEVTLVFTDLVDFPRWALSAGDDASLRLLRRVAQAVEPPLLQAGGGVVKRMGDGMMACFPDPVTAIAAVRDAHRGLRNVEVDGYTPKMRVGIHTGYPQRIGSDYFRTPRTTIRAFVQLLAVLQQNPGATWTDLIGTVEVVPDRDGLAVLDGASNDSADELASFRL